MSVSLCVQRTGQSDQFKENNKDQFKMVKATGFNQIWHACSQGQFGHDPLNIFRKGVMTRVT